MKKFISILVAALLICSALPFAVAAYDVKDTAATIEEGVYIIHPADDNALCLGVEGGIEKAKDQGPVELQKASDSETSMFLIRRDRGKSGTTGKDGAYVILSVHSLRAVGILGIGYSGSGKTNINMTTDSRFWGGVWFLVDAGNGRYSIRCGLKSTTESAPAWLGVDSVSNGNNTYVSGNKSTLWTLEKVKYLPKTLEGAGTADDPCQISTPEQLTEFANYVADFSAYRGMHFKLTKDITYNGPKIGTELYPFGGVFDGDGHTLDVQIPGEIVSYKKTGEGEEKTVVKIPSSSYTGLFSSLDGATVKNLKIKGTVSSTGEDEGFVGAVAGYAYGGTLIDNCTVTADVSVSGGNIGGIAGAMSNSTISNCRMDGNVTNTGLIGTGGIVGSIVGCGEIHNCVNTGKVTGDKVVGGIVGGIVGVGEKADLESAVMDALESAVMVARDKGDKVIGNIISGKTTIENCSSLGSTAENTAGCGSDHGGIVGYIDSTVESIYINNCLSRCEIGISKYSGYIIGNYQDICQTWTLEDINYIPRTFTGEGTADDPYLISDSEQLAEFANFVADLSAYRGIYFKLAKDITYNGSKIGDEKYPFRGVFDGDGHTIHAQISGGSYTGLFASLDGATVKNLNIKGTVSGTGAGACAVGAVAGHAYGGTVIDNCHVTADVSGADGNIGGIAGAMSNSTISNCRMDGNVTNVGWTSTGGIVGGILGGGNIYNCTNTGKVTGDKAVGGILGCVMGGKTVIGNCSSLGSTAENTKNGGSEHGGIVGFIDGNVESFTICNCFSQCIIGISESSGYVIGNNLGAGQISVESVFYVVNGNAGKAFGTGNRINNTSIKSAKSSNDTTASSTLNRNVESYNAKGYAFSKWGKNNAGLFPISCAFDANYNVSYASVFSEKNTVVLIVLSAVVLVALVGVAVLYVMKKKKA